MIRFLIFVQKRLSGFQLISPGLVKFLLLPENMSNYQSHGSPKDKKSKHLTQLYIHTTHTSPGMRVQLFVPTDLRVFGVRDWLIATSLKLLSNVTIFSF